MKAVSPNDFIEVNDVLCRFFLSFDRRDWASMADCLSSLVFIDYSSSGREKPSTMSGKDLIKRRENAVDSLAKHHSFSNLLQYSAESLLAEADARLYQAKRAGRNRVAPAAACR